MSGQVLDNPYDPSSPDLMPELIPLDEIIRRAILDALMTRVNVWRPAEVVAVNGNQRVDLQILLKVKYVNSKTASLLPVIKNCMVWTPAGSGYSIKVPTKVGDTGVALFCDRSLDIWSNGTGGPVDPNDSRTHAIQDAVFIPGLLPFPMQTTDQTNDLVVTCGGAQLRLNPSGNGGFLLKNKDNELMAQLISLVQTLAAASTVTGGPFIPSVVTALNSVVTALQDLQGGA